MVRLSNLGVLQILAENARTPCTKMAKILGVSDTAVRKKIKKLEAENIIRKYTIDIDYKKTGLDVNAYIGVDTEPEHYISSIEKLKKMGEVAALYSSSGDHMILIETWLKDTPQLTKFIKKLEAIKGVKKICPAIIQEKIK